MWQIKTYLKWKGKQNSLEYLSFIKCIHRLGPNTLHCTTSSPKVQFPFLIEVHLLQNQRLLSGSKVTCIRLYAIKKTEYIFYGCKISMPVQMKWIRHKTKCRKVSDPIMHIYTKNVFHVVNRFAKDKVIFHKEDSQGLLSNTKFP